MPGKGFFLDEKLKELVQELGNAINESLSDSDRIAGAIGEIKRAGYDVFLVLEATIGFNKRDEEEEDRAKAAFPIRLPNPFTNPTAKFGSPPKTKSFCAR